MRAGRSGRRRWLRDYGGPALTIAGLVLAWEVGVAAARVPIWLLPPPTAIVAALWAWRGQAPRHTWATLYEVLGGFVLAIAIGLPLAVAIVYSPFVRRVTYPVLLVFQSIPKVALAPLLLLYLGYGIQTNITVAAIVAFFPIVVNTVTGLESVEPELLQLARFLDAGALRVFWKVRLPWALPHIFSALKVAVSLAVIGAVVGEFVGSDRGLGYAIVTASSSMNTSLVFGIMGLLALMGIAVFYAVWLVEMLACPWYQPPPDADRPTL
ncbi:MAG: ABC transporter permease [Candidatus Rokubacteria bacterium]|nr:ABC transporter permease [Candidatus Rokubacteria bacterium]